MGIDAAPAFVRIHQWKHAIPQYNLGYQNVLNAIDVLERNEPGIFVCSNYRGGISVSDCMINADRITERVASFFSPAAG
jgi:oxygen-dependent protoporphyrinogen oxidase